MKNHRPPDNQARHADLLDAAYGWDSAGAPDVKATRRRTLPVFETDYDRVLQWDALTRTALICAMGLWAIPLALLAIRLGFEITHQGDVFIALAGVSAMIALMVLVQVRSAGTRAVILLAHGAEISYGALIARDVTAAGSVLWCGLALIAAGGLGIAANLALVACLKRIDHLKLPAPLQSRLGSLRNRGWVKSAVDQLRIEQDGDSAAWAGSAPATADRLEAADGR